MRSILHFFRRAAHSVSASAAGSKSEKPEPTSEKRGLWHVTWGRKLLFGVPEGCIEKERYPRAWGGAPFQSACSKFYTTFRIAVKLDPAPLSIDPWALHLRCLRHLPPWSVRSWWWWCCNAFAGAAVTLQFSSALVPPHHAPLAARRAARCCSAFVVKLASHWHLHATSWYRRVIPWPGPSLSTTIAAMGRYCFFGKPSAMSVVHW